MHRTWNVGKTGPTSVSDTCTVTSAGKILLLARNKEYEDPLNGIPQTKLRVHITHPGHVGRLVSLHTTGKALFTVRDRYP